MNSSNTIPKSQVISFTAKESDNEKLIVDTIAENSKLSKSLIKRLMVFGCVYQTIKDTRKRVRKAKSFLRQGNLIEVYYDAGIDLEQEYKFRNIFETKHYGVYLKPMGALTEGTDYGDQASLIRHVEKARRKAYVVNRMDKYTEGLVVVAYDSKTQNLLQQMWRKDVLKKYQAVVLGEMSGSGELTHEINKKFSQTNYECIKTENNQTFVDITAITERKHQIRIHFAKAGHPIIGDPDFGKGNKNEEGLELVSYLLEFTDPYTKKEISVSLPSKRLLF